MNFPHERSRSIPGTKAKNNSLSSFLHKKLSRDSSTDFNSILAFREYKLEEIDSLIDQEVKRIQAEISLKAAQLKKELALASQSKIEKLIYSYTNDLQYALDKLFLPSVDIQNKVYHKFQSQMTKRQFLQNVKSFCEFAKKNWTKETIRTCCNSLYDTARLGFVDYGTTPMVEIKQFAILNILSSSHYKSEMVSLLDLNDSQYEKYKDIDFIFEIAESKAILDIIYNIYQKCNLSVESIDVLSAVRKYTKKIKLYAIELPIHYSEFLIYNGDIYFQKKFFNDAQCEYNTTIQVKAKAAILICALRAICLGIVLKGRNFYDKINEKFSLEEIKDFFDEYFFDNEFDRDILYHKDSEFLLDKSNYDCNGEELKSKLQKIREKKEMGYAMKRRKYEDEEGVSESHSEDNTGDKTSRTEHEESEELKAESKKTVIEIENENENQNKKMKIEDSNVIVSEQNKNQVAKIENNLNEKELPDSEIAKQNTEDQSQKEACKENSVTEKNVNVNQNEGETQNKESNTENPVTKEIIDNKTQQETEKIESVREEEVNEKSKNKENSNSEKSPENADKMQDKESKDNIDTKELVESSQSSHMQESKLEQSEQRQPEEKCQISKNENVEIIETQKNEPNAFNEICNIDKKRKLDEIIPNESTKNDESRNQQTEQKLEDDKCMDNQNDPKDEKIIPQEPIKKDIVLNFNNDETPKDDMEIEKNNDMVVDELENEKEKKQFNPFEMIDGFKE